LSARSATVALLIAAGYHLGGVVGLGLSFPGGIAGVWLPHGVLVAAMLLTPTRRWWWFTLLLPLHLHLVRTFQGPVPLGIACVQLGGNLAQAALGAAALQRFVGRPPRLDNLTRMIAFISLAAFLAPGLVSGALAWQLPTGEGAGGFWIAWQRHAFAQACGAVVVTPAIVYLARGGLVATVRAARPWIGEFLLLTVGLVALLLALFGVESRPPHHLGLPFALLPLLLWSAVRFGPGGLGCHLLAVTIVALLHTRAGRGPFAAGTPDDAVLALQGFLLAISIPNVLLTALMQQHAQLVGALRDSETRYRSVVEDQTELICRCLRDGTYIFVNGAYCRYFQRSPAELIGQNFWQFIPPEQHAATRAYLASLTPDRPLGTIEHQVVAPGGEVRWQQWTDRAFFDGQGRVVEYQSVGQDITERKRAQDEHRELVAQKRVAEALREADRRKDEFLAMLAHELRNPLAPIVTAVELLRARAPADESITWAGAVIDRQAGQLTRLVDDLLDVSRITLGKIQLDLAPLDLGNVVRQAVESSRPLLQARHHDLQVDLPDHPLPIRGDAARLIQVISNLLGNAAKYTAEGGRIRVAAAQVGAQVVLRVADNGQGMPADMLERVFEMFVQLQSPENRPQGGLGIGLALVKRLVEMHGGAVEARSDGSGRGSEIVVHLDLADEPSIAQEGDRPPRPLAGGSDPPDGRRRILIVDDNVDAAETLARLLRLQQHEVLVAHDGLAGLAAAQRTNPDLIFLDIGLPRLSGLEVARRLRQGTAAGRPLLVATTGFGRIEDRARSAAAGFDHHLTKPVDAQALQSLVRAATVSAR
jgi:PAS domain S-box-containing protein